MHGLVKGNQYTISFKGQYSDGTTFPWGYQDYATVSGTGVESQVCYFVKDFNINNYSFTFTAGEDNTMVLTFPAVQDDAQFTFTVTDLLIDGDYVAGIQDLYGKVDGKWQIYEPYEAGDNITIVDNVISATDTKYTAGSNVQISNQNVISATDTDEIAELEDVSLTNLANGQILKYNSTTQKWENAEDSGGSEVEANPSGTATDTLTKLGIDGTVYEIQGGGGVEVVDIDYDDYVALPSADKHDKTKLYAVKNAPDGNVRCSYVEETKTLYFNWGAVYDETTKTLVIR